MLRRKSGEKKRKKMKRSSRQRRRCGMWQRRFRQRTQRIWMKEVEFALGFDYSNEKEGESERAEKKSSEKSKSVVALKNEVGGL